MDDNDTCHHIVSTVIDWKSVIITRWSEILRSWVLGNLGTNGRIGITPEEKYSELFEFWIIMEEKFDKRSYMGIILHT